MKYKSVKRIAIGQHGIITAERARDKALAILADIKDGGDPQGAKEDKLKAKKYSKFITFIGSND